MTEQQNGVSPATAGGAPLPETIRRKIWVAAEDLANTIGCTVIEGAPRSYGTPAPIGEPGTGFWVPHAGGRCPELNHRVGDLCGLAYGHVGEHATPAGVFRWDKWDRPDPRDAEIERLRKDCADNIEEWKRADAEVTRLRKLVGNEAVPDGWNGKDRQEAIVRAEESYSEWLKMRDERDRLRAELDRIREQQQAGDIAIAVLENIRPQLRTIARSIGLDGHGSDTTAEAEDALGEQQQAADKPESAWGDGRPLHGLGGAE